MTLLLLLRLLLASNAAAWDGGRNPLNCRDCNVILIVLDPLRADKLGMYGYPKNTAPNIDGLARRGAVFLNAFSPTPYTTPSIMSLLTSLYPSRHGVRFHLVDSLNERFQTLGSALRRDGYRTIWASETGDAYINHLAPDIGFGRGFEEFCPPDKPRSWTAYDRCLRRNKDKKFFFYLHSFNTHAPYTAESASILRLSPVQPRTDILSPSELSRRVQDQILEDPSVIFKPEVLRRYSWIFKLDGKGALARRVKWFLVKHLARIEGTLQRSIFMLSHDLFFDQFDPKKPRDLAEMQALYDASIFETDAQVGGLLETVDRLGLGDHTVVVITAGHGEEFMEHGQVEHGKQVYSESVHVPLIFAVPSRTVGRRISAVAQSIDVAPTILEAVGAPPMRQAQGTSLLPEIDGPGLHGPRYAFSHWKNQWSVRDRRFTYLLKTDTNGTAPRAAEELYDRDHDPLEERNILRENSGLARLYRNILARHIDGEGAEAPPSWPNWMSEAAKQRMQRQGYW